MNLNPSNWFWSQRLIVILFVVVYITISLSPWYYNVGVAGDEPQSLKAFVISNINTDEETSSTGTEFERKYANGGSMSSLDNLIAISYIISLTYVLGLFLSRTKTAILVNIPILVFMLLKTYGITNLNDVYQVSIRNVIIWWICLLIYYIAFFINDRVVITDINRK